MGNNTCFCSDVQIKEGLLGVNVNCYISFPKIKTNSKSLNLTYLHKSKYIDFS